MTDHSLMKHGRPLMKHGRRDGSELSAVRKVLLEERKFRVTRTGSRRFRTVRSVSERGAVGAAGTWGGAVPGFADSAVCGGGGGWGGTCVSVEKGKWMEFAT